MPYLVRIVGPSGMERYLCRGREVSRENATVYAHPSGAKRAMDDYLAMIHPYTHKGPLGDVIDATDPERIVE